MNWIGRKLQRRRVRCEACGKEYQKRDTVEVESELGAPKRYCAKCIKAPFGGEEGEAMNDTDLVDEKLASRLQPICTMSKDGFTHEPCGQTFHSFGGGADSLLDHPCPALTPDVVMARAQAYMEKLLAC